MRLLSSFQQNVSICLNSLGWPFREQVDQQTTCHIHHKRYGQTQWQRITRQIPSPSTLTQSPCMSSSRVPLQSKASGVIRAEESITFIGHEPWPLPGLQAWNGLTFYYVKRVAPVGILLLSLYIYAKEKALPVCSCCEHVSLLLELPSHVLGTDDQDRKRQSSGASGSYPQGSTV